MESQVKVLKINAERINKTLAEGNKRMRKLRADEKRLFSINQNKIKLKQREDLIEGKKKQRLGSGIAQRVVQPAISFIDKLKDFFILLGAGVLVNSLPAIITRIEKFLEDNKELIENVKFIVGEIGKLSMMFIELTQKLTPGKEEQIKKDLDALDKFLGETDLKDIDKSLKDLGDIDGELNIPPPAPLGTLPVNPNPPPASQKAPTPINSVSKKPVELEEFNKAVKKVNKVINTYNYPHNKKVLLPGVGYVSRTADWFGFASKVKYESPDAIPLTKEEFFLQARSVEERLKGYSRGGTVENSINSQDNSLTIKNKPIVNLNGIDSFTSFQKSSIDQAINIGEKVTSNNILENLVENIEKLFGLQDKKKNNDPSSPGDPSDPSDPFRGPGPLIGRGDYDYGYNLPPTNTLRGQRYGAPRDDDGDGKPDRKHAGTDFDISGNESFPSQIGGIVTNIGFDPKRFGYGHYVDIYNDKLNVTERIAEGARILPGIKKGSVVQPGTPVVQGESETGVIHYEIRDGKNTTFGYTGTRDPLQFLKQHVPHLKTTEPENLNLPISNLKSNTNLDRSSLLAMQSPEDVGSSALVVFVRQPTIIAT